MYQLIHKWNIYSLQVDTLSSGFYGAAGKFLAPLSVYLGTSCYIPPFEWKHIAFNPGNTIHTSKKWFIIINPPETELKI